MLIWLKNQGKVRYRTFQLRLKELADTHDLEHFKLLDEFRNRKRSLDLLMRERDRDLADKEKTQDVELSEVLKELRKGLESQVSNLREMALDSAVLDKSTWRGLDKVNERLTDAENEKPAAIAEAKQALGELPLDFSAEFGELAEKRDRELAVQRANRDVVDNFAEHVKQFDVEKVVRLQREAQTLKRTVFSHLNSLSFAVRQLSPRLKFVVSEQEAR